MTELEQQISDLRQGDHLCLFYEKEPAEQMPAVIPFIQEGLSRDEQFIYIADDQTVEQLAQQLQGSGVDVEKERKRGALKLWTRRQWRQPGELDSQKKALQVLRMIQKSDHSGFKGVRFAVEMTWLLNPAIKPWQIEHWEATINTIFVPGFNGRILCQYNCSRLSPEVILAALRTHALAILGDQVYPNLFYEAPLILDGSDQSSAAKVEWMISQLKRERTAQKAQKELRERMEMEVARAVEREQLRLGQELHDGVGQQLTGIRYMLSRLRDQLTRVSPPHAREAGKLEALTSDSGNKIRNLAKDFYPVELEKHGLLSALKGIPAREDWPSNISCVVKSDKDSSFSDLKGPLGIQLFRLAQEAVHNVLKHAHAKRIEILLAAVKGDIVLTVKDDGVGFPLDLDETEGMGLQIMQYRARIIGGHLNFRNNPGGGAIVTCRVPATSSPLKSTRTGGLRILQGKRTAAPQRGVASKHVR